MLCYTQAKLNFTFQARNWKLRQYFTIFKLFTKNWYCHMITFEATSMFNVGSSVSQVCLKVELAHEGFVTSGATDSRCT